MTTDRGAIRGRLFAAFAAVAIPPILLLAGIVLVLLGRSFERTAASRLESGIAAVLGTLAGAEDAARARIAGIALDEEGDLRGFAAATGRRLDLGVLEVVDPGGVVLSSLHWPAGYGLREQDRVFPDAPRFRVEKAAEGYGAADRLAVVAERAVPAGGREVVVRGGSFVDPEALEELARLTGTAVAIRDEGGGRWIAGAGSPLAAWAGPPDAATEGEAVLEGERFRWQARPLAKGLTLVVAVPRAAIAEVMGGVGRATVIASAIALALALVAASLLSSRIAAPVVEELEDSRERVLQAERVAAWREMARRLAHELKNPIFPIQLSIETLRRVAAEDPSGQRLAAAFRDSSATILDELRALTRIVDEFSRFARMPAPRPAPVSVNEVADQALALYRPRAGGVEVSAALADGLPPVVADRDLLARALGNLIGNALDALGGAGRLAVRTSAAGGEVKIEVADTGPGLGPDQRTRLFTPYYTTKKGGTGLGLAIVQGIVSDHGGRVEVESAPGAGTTFTIFLPAAG